MFWKRTSRYILTLNNDCYATHARHFSFLLLLIVPSFRYVLSCRSVTRCTTCYHVFFSFCQVFYVPSMTLHLNVIQLQNYIYWLDIFTYEHQRALEMATTRAQVERDAHCGLRSRVTDASIIHVMSRNSNCLSNPLRRCLLGL